MLVAIYFYRNSHQGLSRLFTWQAVLGYPLPPFLHSTSIQVSLSFLPCRLLWEYIMLLAVCNSFISLSKATLVYFAIEHTISYMLPRNNLYLPINFWFASFMICADDTALHMKLRPVVCFWLYIACTTFHFHTAVNCKIATSEWKQYFSGH